MAIFKKKKEEIKDHKLSAKENVKVASEHKVKKTVLDSKQLGWAYDLIKKPHITEKAVILSEQGKYVFDVYYTANKSEIIKAVKALYGVNVIKINSIHMPSKQRRMGAIKGWQHGLEKGYKKAIVTLAQGEKIDVMPK